MITCDQNLGNQTTVSRIAVDTFNKEAAYDGYGNANAPMQARGSLVEFKGSSSARPGRVNAVCGKKRAVHSMNAAYGVLSEAIADSMRRRARPGRTPTDMVLPITFDGIDIATAEERHICEFIPGDPVFYDFTRHRLFTSSPTYSPSNAELRHCTFLGTAAHNTPANTFSVPLRVDSLSVIIDPEP